jgi:hypothetical protein
MTMKVIAVTLAVAVVGGTIALAQSLKPRATNGANVHAMNLDRCPHYPSPVFCRSQAHERDQMGRDAKGR